jgi:hypothetical protein
MESFSIFHLCFCWICASLFYQCWSGTNDSAGQCSFSSQIPGDGRYVPLNIEEGEGLIRSDQGHIKSQSNEHSNAHCNMNRTTRNVVNAKSPRDFHRTHQLHLKLQVVENQLLPSIHVLWWILRKTKLYSIPEIGGIWD